MKIIKGIIGALAAVLLLKGELLFLIMALIMLLFLLIHKKGIDEEELRSMLYPGF